MKLETKARAGKLAVIVSLTLISAEAQVGVNSTVYPTGVYPADCSSVKSAVSQGGAVLLKAMNAGGAPTAFNFGPPAPGSCSVSLTRDVTITGEIVGTNMTSIRGGNFVFNSIFPVRSSIRGIFFDNPRTAALVIFATNGAEFSHNRVTNIVGRPYYGTFGPLKSQGVWVNGPTNQMDGGIVIEDNIIQNSLGSLGYGLALFSIGTEVRIARNYITGANAMGILVGVNTKSVTIEDNVSIPGPGFDPTVGSGNGIQGGPGLGGSFLIRRNTVKCENPFADGILLVASVAAYGQTVSNSTIEDNDVTMHNSIFGGISLYGSVMNSLVKTNKVSGDGAFALDGQVGFLDDDLAEFNTFQGNNISHFTGGVADVFFDVNTIENVLVGHSGSVVDLGAGNRITGFTPMGHANIGQRIKAAQESKRAFLKSLMAVEGPE